MLADTAEARAFAAGTTKMGEMTAHPTAIVEARRQARRRRQDRALLRRGLGSRARRRRRARRATRSSPGSTTIGARTRIFPFASIGHQPQDLKYRGEASTLAIGADCIIREGVTINPGTAGGGMATTVGDRCAFLANSHVGHDCHVGNNVIFSNNVMLAGHCTVGDFAILGGGAAVIQFARVGAHAFLGGMSGLENDLIPYGMALGNRAHLSGLNIVGLQRRGFSRERHPRPAPRLPAAVRGRGHADGARRRRGRRSSPTTRSCRRSSRSSAPAASVSLCTPKEAAEA